MNFFPRLPRVAPVFISSLLLTVSVPSFAGPEAANRLFREGLEEYLAGNYVPAMGIFIEALKEDETHHGAKAFILKTREQLAREQDEARRALREQERLQRRLEEEREREEALKRQELEDDTPEARARSRAHSHYLKGLEYVSEDNLALALREWDLSLLWDPDNTELAALAERTRRELDIVSRANLLEKRIGEAYTYYQEGNLADSLEAWREVQRIDPASPTAAEYIKEIRERLSQRERDAYEARRSEQQKREISSLMEKGRDAMSAKRYSEAAGKFGRALKLDPGHEEAGKMKAEAEKALALKVGELLEEGSALLEKEDYAGASRKFHAALQADPGNRQAAGYIEKLRRITSARERRRRQQQVRRMYFDAAGLYMNGEYDECRAVVDEIFELDPGNENAYKLLDRLERVRRITSGN